MGEVLRFERNTSNVVLNNTSIGVEVKRASFGGGGGGPMEPTVSMKEYVDKADEAVESRLTRQLDKLPTKGTVWGAVGTGVGLIIALAAFGSDRFNGGLSVSPVVSAVQQKQAETDKAQDAKLDLMNDKLDILIKQGAKK